MHAKRTELLGLHCKYFAPLFVSFFFISFKCVTFVLSLNGIAQDKPVHKMCWCYVVENISSNLKVLQYNIIARTILKFIGDSLYSNTVSTQLA